MSVMLIWEAPILTYERAVFEINANHGGAVLDPDGTPIIRLAGNCAIAARTSHRHVPTWNTVRAVTEVLRAQCVSFPIKSRTGSRVRAQAVRKLSSQLFGKRSTPLSQKHFRSQSMYLCSPDSVERASPILPPSVAINVYC